MSLTALAEQLLENAKKLDAYNEHQGKGPITFETEHLVGMDSEMEGCRREFIDQAADLKRLAQSPLDLFCDSFGTFAESASLHVIYHYKIPAHVPRDGSISYTDLSAATGVPPVFLRRMLHLAIVNKLFAETEHGEVCHTALSRELHSEQGAMDAAGFWLEDMLPAATKVVESIVKNPEMNEPTETGFSLAFNTNSPIYLEMQKTPDRARRFGSALAWLVGSYPYSPQQLVRGYDWAHIDHPETVVVDVGGSIGAVSLILAQATKNMHFVVQDLPDTAAQGAKLCPPAMQDRISFQGHDFFTEQPVKGADVYLLKYICHNWPDAYSQRILKALVPALRDGSKILICEGLGSDRAPTKWSGRLQLVVDTVMAIGFNAALRSASDWEKMFAAVDSRLHLKGIYTPPDAAISVIEAEFRTEKSVNGVS